MYVHARTLAWLARPGVFRGVHHWRRCLYTAGFSAGYAFLCGVVSLARALDEVLYPALATTPVPSPLFVVATPRSGTTYLHHLLSLDQQRYASFRLYQTIAPSLLLDRVIHHLSELDRQTDLGLNQLVDAIDRRMFSDWDDIHRVGLRAPEEDENLFVYNLVTPALYLLFPHIERMPEFTDASRLGAHALTRLAAEYRASVQRLLLLSGPERTPLLKTVLLPSRMPVAELAFPDARYVHVLRDPREAIPSAVSMFYTMWQTHSPSIPAISPATRALADMFLHHTRILCEQRRTLPPERCVTVRYEALRRDPMIVIQQIYRAFELPVSQEFQARLRDATRQGRRFKSRHHYGLEQFGLGEGDIQRPLAEYWHELCPSG